VTTVATLEHAPWASVAGLVHGFLPGRVAAPAATWFPRQVHGAHVVEGGGSGERPEADAAIAPRPGVVVGVVTADCAPILLLAAERRVAAAVHAGWRGAASGVLEQTLEQLQRKFDVEPAAVEAVVGPTIGGCCYEVGPEVRAAFARRVGNKTAEAWARRGARDMLDLRVAIAALGRRAGIASVTILGPCTRCSPSYCSYRRDGADAGRQASFIGWR
jgi:hypothetical protein